MGHRIRGRKWKMTPIIGLVLITALAGPAASQTSMSSKSAPAPTVTIEPQIAPPNQIVQLTVTIPLDPGLHLYGPNVEKPFHATKLTVTTPGPITWDPKPIYPKTTTLESFGQTFSVLQPDKDAVTLKIYGKVLTNTKPGTYNIEASLTYQACSDIACLPPVVNKNIQAILIIDPSKTIPIVGKEPTSVNNEGYGSSFSLFSYNIDLNKTGLILPLIVAFIAGLILNIMPCVLPVIPIKILQLTKQAHQEHHSPFRLALIFSAGIITFFLAIGIVALILKNGFSWGQSFQNPSVLIGLCLILILLALGMFDVYQVMIPSIIANHEIVRKGYLGAYSMGFLAGILSTPCSFGILGAAIAWAQSQVHIITLLAFLTIGIGMAFPYVLLSGFPKLIQKVPHTGRWSELFKEAMGFLLLGVVGFLVSALPKDRLLPALLFFVVFAAIIWFWGTAIEFHSGNRAKFGRFLVVVAIIVSGWFFLKPPVNPLAWKPFNQTTLTQATKSGKNVVIEFTADWCLNCRTVEYLVFKNKKVKKYLAENNVQLLKADLTGSNPYADTQLKEWAGQAGSIPFTIIIKPDGSQIRLPGVYSPQDLLNALSKPNPLKPECSTWNT